MTRLNLPQNTIEVKDSTGQTAGEFLLSIAGMFSSAKTTTSDNVEKVVSDMILKKYGGKGDELSD